MIFSRAMEETEIEVACRSLGLNATVTADILARFRRDTGKERPRRGHGQRAVRRQSGGKEIPQSPLFEKRQARGIPGVSLGWRIFRKIGGFGG